MNYVLPILSVLLGFAVAVIVRPKNNKNLKLLLAFSGGFLLSLVSFSLLPDVYHSHEDHLENPKLIGVFIMVGIMLQIFLEFFSKGAEHGHVHLHKHEHSFPWMLFISLSLHSLLEGFPLHHHSSLVYGIMIHKLPVAIILSSFFLESEISKTKVGIFLVLFSLMTPLGALVSEIMVLPHHIEIYVSALVIGVLLHIATTILFETSENHKFNLSKFATIILGIVMAYFIN